MARRSEHTLEQIREMVLTAAQRIINDEGVEALTVRKIALEIGYTVGSIYMVFANMQELLLHIKACTLDDLANSLPKLNNTDSIEQQISHLADAYLAFASANFNRWRITFANETVMMGQLPAWYQEKLASSYTPMEILFRQLPAKHSSEHAIIAARALCCGIYGICILVLNGNTLQPKAECSHAVNVLVDGFVRGWTH